jgi:hypothetical protein
MFLFITNVKALTFNVNLTDIEDKGSDTIGIITSKDVSNKTLDVLFQDIGDEVNFGLTFTNSGDRAGTLRSITVTSTNNKIEYTNNLPEGGLSINGNDTNEVIIKAKLLEGATNGTSSSEIKITYNYDEGSCPDGEILSSDESMCLCPEGKERNERGICVEPEKEIECRDDEIYNETKKICEKKIVPVNPSNPKTLDNIILITLLFIVSGLGIYAVMFKKLKTDKKKITVGVITGVITLGASFSVLVSVFGLDNLLSAIINPITKSKEITVTVNEEIELIETWDGECSVTNLTPSTIFEGGTGTESDPYQIKTAEQLSCFAKSVNNGTTYEGKYLIQTKNIKLNENLIDKVTAGTTTGIHAWIPIGNYDDNPTFEEGGSYFAGTYDGDNHKISGLYIDDSSAVEGMYIGLFGSAKNATFKQISLVDTSINLTVGTVKTGALLGYGYNNLTIDNVDVSGKGSGIFAMTALVGIFDAANSGSMKLTNVVTNMNLTTMGPTSGMIYQVNNVPSSNNPNIEIENVTNKGTINTNAPVESGGIIGQITGSGNIKVNNSSNEGTIAPLVSNNGGNHLGGLFGNVSSSYFEMRNSHNIGEISNIGNVSEVGGLVGLLTSATSTIEECYNSGNITYSSFDSDGVLNDNRTILMNVGGIVGKDQGALELTKTFNSGNIKGTIAQVGGLIGEDDLLSGQNSDESYTTITNCYNVGELVTTDRKVGGLVGKSRSQVNSSYNSGKITIWYPGSTMSEYVGGLVGTNQDKAIGITNSYNKGEIVITAKTESVLVGGLCGVCRSINNSYNRGNITSKYAGSSIGGIVAVSTGSVQNVYNSGNIKFENASLGNISPHEVRLAGILTDNGEVKNVYNLGNISFDQHDSNFNSLFISGIKYVSSNATKAVNNGNITVKFNNPVTTAMTVYVHGISFNTYGISDSFNAGQLNVDSAVLENDGLDHSIYVSEISHYYAGPPTAISHFSNPNGKALSNCTNPSACPDGASESWGTYSSQVPTILSIINGDNAFNSELDEDGLPTLKTFNN